jgi:hypothetical protein
MYAYPLTLVALGGCLFLILLGMRLVLSDNPLIVINKISKK